MKKKGYIFLADGFEDIEGLTVVDLMRRAGIDIVTVSIKEETSVITSHGIKMQTDTVFSSVDFDDADLLVLPGGKAGTQNLKAFPPLADLLKSFDAQGRRIAAICAAPTILSDLGLLRGKQATSYPSCQPQINCASYSENKVVTDGHITTSRGMGTSIDFGLALISLLLGEEKATEIADSIVYRPE
ncbi:MAG: DJ-1/PfpI family protein [Blautia sp.]|nr:DJ-1/PfpI family protein [Blautia sp.]